MPTKCPDCGEPLDQLDRFGDMGSRPKRYRCRACQLEFVRDAAGGCIVEVP